MSVTFSDLGGIKSALATLQAPSSKGGWLVLGYSGPKTVVLQSQGTGGVTEAVGQLADDQVQYVVVRIDLKSGAGEGTPDNTKDIFVTWVGPSVKILEKGKKLEHDGAIKAAIQPVHAHLSCKTGRDSFTEDNIRDRISFRGGSHEL